MAITKDKKIEIVKKIKDLASSASSILFFDFSGISANDLNALRGALLEKRAVVGIFKNTLIKRALGEKISGDLTGQTAILFSRGDPFDSIKEFYNFKSGHESILVKFAFLDGALLGSDQLDALAKLPSRDELLAKVLYGFNAPLHGFAGVLSAIPRGLVMVLNGVLKKKAGD